MRLTLIAILMAVILPGAQLALGDYQDGLDAYSEGDYGRAMEEWRAITDGDAGEVVPTIYAEAHYAVAKLYWQGQGVPRDYFVAKEWLERAAELGHAGAQAKLGYMYTDGLAVGQDYVQARHWFEKAAKNGDIDGLYNLGIFYLNGWGVEADRTMAKQHLASASALGDPESEAALQQLLKEEDAERAEQEAAREAFLAQITPRREVTEIPLEKLPEDPVSRFGSIPDEHWILDQTPSRYTIQVMALSSLDKLMDVIAGYEESLAPLAIYRLENDGRPLYVLVQGNYDNVETARAARDVFPSRVQRPSRLWIRQFEMVQKLIHAEPRQ